MVFLAALLIYKYLHIYNIAFPVKPSFKKLRGIKKLYS